MKQVRSVQGATGYACHMGGRGLNQSIALRQAGADIYHAGKIGCDDDILVDMLKQYGKAQQKCFPKADILLTLGEAGAEYIWENHHIRQEAFSVPVVDTTAAGDTFLGYFVARTTLGDTVELAMQLAAAAAALAVSTAGAAQSIPSLAKARKAFAAMVS